MISFTRSQRKVHRSPLDGVHHALGATFAHHGDWKLPFVYTSKVAEHNAVRTAAGLFDMSHMTEFLILGPRAGEFLDSALAGHLSKLDVGKGHRSLVLSEFGGIIEDLVVYRIRQHTFLIIGTAGNRKTLARTLEERLAPFEASVQVADISDGYALLAVHGPQSATIVTSTEGVVASGIGKVGVYASVVGEFGDTPLLVMPSEQTGEVGFELLIPTDRAEPLWDALLTSGAPYGLQPAGLDAHDTLRLEAGTPRYGRELALDVAPTQVGLGEAVSIDGKDFAGTTALRALPSSHSPVLVGLVSSGRQPSRAGNRVFDTANPNGKAVGEVTSAALSPTLGHPVAMALVAPARSGVGTDLFIDIDGNRISARVAELPFYQRSSSDASSVALGKARAPRR
jgi:aminomethyltransferase